MNIKADWHKTEKGCWSLSLGERGCRVRVMQREPGGVFLRETWFAGTGKRSEVSLRTTSREEARKSAEAFFLALIQGDKPASVSPLTLRELWETYRQDAPAYRQLSEKSRKGRDASATLLMGALGPNKVVDHLTLADVESYSEVRRMGKGWRDGRVTNPVRSRTVASELQVLRHVLLWGCKVRREDGSWLVKENPLRGLRLPREENPRRPVATFDRFEKVRGAMRELAEAAPQERGKVRWTRMELALVLAEATGARIGAIQGLRWSDISYDPARIRWRAEFDKRGRERTVPIPARLADEVRTFQVRLKAVGEGWMFPSISSDDPWPTAMLGELLRKAEKHAELPHLKGGVWHPYRRKWATERKHLPLVDVAAAGGWKDYKTLLTCYQHTDETSMLAVMAEPTKLLSLAAGGGKT